jgi:hypothetical protein
VIPHRVLICLRIFTGRLVACRFVVSVATELGSKMVARCSVFVRQKLSEFTSRLFGKLVAPAEFQLADFELGPDVVPVATFDPLAQPFAIGKFGNDRRVAIFDESTVRWKVSPDRAKREFKRNIAMATTLFDIVAVCCATLQSDVDDMRARMYGDCRKRVPVLTGALASEVGEHLEPMMHFQ